MSGRKSNATALWVSCDCCNVIIPHKDGTNHKQNCPPDFQNWTHSFIHLEHLYSFLDFFTLEDKGLSFVPQQLKNDVVLMPCHVLQLCKIPMGDPVSIRIKGGKSSAEIVKIAWPTEEKNSGFSFSLSEEVGKLYDLQLGDEVIVSKISKKIRTAESVTVFCENSFITSSDVRNLLMRLKGENQNKIFNIGNKLLLRNYGNKIIFRITEMNSSQKGETTLEGDFFLITSNTRWKFDNVDEEKQKNRNLIKKLGGLNSTIEDLKEVIKLGFSRKHFLAGIQVTKGILIYGTHGTGKTTLIEALAEELTDNVIRIEYAKIFSKYLGETERELQNLFEKAKQMSPAIILIDDLDVLCNKSNTSTESKTRISSILSSELDKLNKLDAGVVVLGTTSKIHQIDRMLRCPTRFGKEVEIHIPEPRQRFEILKVLLSDVNHNLKDNEVEDLANCSHGFVGADLVSFVSKAVLKNYKTNNGIERETSFEDFLWALSKVKPSAMKEVMTEVSNVRWDDIGGQEELKLKLRQCIEWPLKYRDSFSKLGLTPPKGVLMYGPPGCSKTMIAKAVATESQLNFISVKGPELFSKWVGESEGAVRKVFKKARENAPSIIFFDELDAIGGSRTTAEGNGSNVQERVLAQLLTELDGVESLDNVIVIAATNRLDRIDPALIRPGRLDRIIYVPLPDSKTREEIFRLQLKKTQISDDVVLDELVVKSEGYSAAEIVAVSREAALKALEENRNAEIVERKHFLEAFSVVLPRTPEKLLKLYNKYTLK